jgi:hypothetical protein
MITDTALREVRVLIERYLEVSNHYARESRNFLREYNNSPSRLSTLIDRLEAIVIDPTSGADRPAAEESAQEQNIVRTPDTLAALRISADEILERLGAPMALVPRNIGPLRTWLGRDVAEIDAGFPSFTYAWDKLIDLNRLTLAPDSRFLRVRDNVTLATMEFGRFVLELNRLAVLSEGDEASSGTVSEPKSDATPETALKNVCTSLMTILDTRFDARVEHAVKLLRRRNDSMDEASILRDADRDVDALALLGLELGLTRWLGFASPSKEHRKTIIMGLLVCSKQFLIERSWRNAKEFSAFAIALIAKMNQDLKLPATDGTPMLRFNQLWAQYKLGEDIGDEVEQWDVTELHARYNFLKSVLMRKFDDAVRLLQALLPDKDSGEAGNFSIEEAEEWPILEDLRSSKAYDDLKREPSEQAHR